MQENEKCYTKVYGNISITKFKNGGEYSKNIISCD